MNYTTADYLWNERAVISRLNHPELYQHENVPEVIGRLMLWLKKHEHLKPKGAESV